MSRWAAWTKRNTNFILKITGLVSGFSESILDSSYAILRPQVWYQASKPVRFKTVASNPASTSIRGSLQEQNSVAGLLGMVP